MPTPFKPPILISEKAAAKFADFLYKDENQKSLKVFMVGVLENRGCSGNKYYIKPFDFDKIEKNLFDFFIYNKISCTYNKYDSSKLINTNNIIFAIDRFSLFKLIGSTVDFSDGDRLSKGFFFTNPNETGRCGCGESFST